MLFAVLALAGAASWVPMRWHSSAPKSLELLTGTPVNCILLEPRDWKPAFLEAARKRKIVALGVAHTTADVVAARESRLDAVVLEGPPDAALRAAAGDYPLIELPPRAAIRLDENPAITGTSQALWPGVEAEHGGRTVLGPTSTPWINTNGGFLRFLRASTSGVIWIGVRPPPRTIFPVDRYARVIGDAALAGARWILALDEDLDSRLLAGDAAAIKDWRTIAGYLAYYESHPEWRGYRAYSRLAVIQSAANGGLLSGSLLDMLSSQRSSVRVIPPHRFTPAALKGARVVLDVDPDLLTPAQKDAVDEFAKAGGTVVNPPARWRFPEPSNDQILLDRRQANQLQSLWEVTYNATVRKNFGARTFNTTGILSSVLASPDGSSVIVHLLNFLDFPGESITVHVLGKWKHARVYRLDGPTVDLPVFDVPEGTGVEVETLPIMATLRFE